LLSEGCRISRSDAVDDTSGVALLSRQRQRQQQQQQQWMVTDNS